jgi:hypothetical protein
MFASFYIDVSEVLKWIIYLISTVLTGNWFCKLFFWKGGGGGGVSRQLLVSPVGSYYTYISSPYHVDCIYIQIIVEGNWIGEEQKRTRNILRNPKPTI